MPRALNPAVIRAQVEALRTSHPDVCDDEDLFQLALQSETDLPDFIAHVVKRMADANAMAIAQAAMIKDMTDQRSRYLARYEAMRELAFKLMQQANVPKLELTQATLWIRKGTPKVIITDEAMLADNVVRIKREPNKSLIKELIDQGITVHGATLSNAEPVLAIRGISK